MIHDEVYWNQRYENNQTPWDAGDITTPLKDYFDQLTDKNIKILIPGCGNAHEAAYLWENGFKNVCLIDIAEKPLNNFALQHPTFPKQQLLHEDFFELVGSFDLVVEQTFFCALHPSERENYIAKVKKLLSESGKLMGVLFDDPLNSDHPPYGGSRDEYLALFQSKFETLKLEPCYNSIKPRQNRELFILAS